MKLEPDIDSEPRDAGRKASEKSLRRELVSIKNRQMVKEKQASVTEREWVSEWSQRR